MTKYSVKIIIEDTDNSYKTDGIVTMEGFTPDEIIRKVQTEFKAKLKKQIGLGNFISPKSFKMNIRVCEFKVNSVALEKDILFTI